jgi:hypothetical protein
MKIADLCVSLNIVHPKSNAFVHNFLFRVTGVGYWGVLSGNVKFWTIAYV